MPAERILIADDDPFLRDLVRQKLGLLGYQVHLARDGLEAVSKTYETRPDLLVLDMLMPEMGGLDALAEIKADVEIAHTPVLMLTAVRGEADVRRAMTLGAAGYVAKPFQLDTFCARVSHLLRAKSASAETAAQAHYLN